jgi:sugar phosphate isomerase/epimerase
MRKIGIEYISVFGLPPVDFVHLAADLGCNNIGTALVPMPFNPHAYIRWSLISDKLLRQRMIVAMRDRGISLSLGEGFMVRPGADVRELAANLDIMCELGAERINALSIDPDMDRTFDQFAALAEMTQAVGVETTLEFIPGTAVNTLPIALKAIHHVARNNFRLLIDSMHLFRSGSTVKDIASLDPAVIGYVQLCDVPLVSPLGSSVDNYMEEAKFERMAPGTGELPLLDLLDVLPIRLPIGLEVPQRSLVESGLAPHEYLGRCVEATRILLAHSKTALH